jgi:hypothetical protein
MRVTTHVRRLGVAFVAAALGLAALSAEASSSPFNRPGQIAMSSDGVHLYVADSYRTVALSRDAATGELALIGSFTGGGDQVELAPDERHLYVVHAGQRVRTFARDAATGNLEHLDDWQRPDIRLADIEFRDDAVAYVTDVSNDALLVFGRDTTTGRIELRRELRNGVDGLDGLNDPRGLVVTAGTLYVHSDEPIVLFRLNGDGDPTRDPDVGWRCGCRPGADLELSPDGERLLSGPLGPELYVRDPVTGRISIGPESANWVRGMGEVVDDGNVAWSTDGRHVYLADWWNRRIMQFDHEAGGLSLRRAYYDGRDGKGAGNARALALSPDERFLYVAFGDAPSPFPDAGISVYQRDPSSGELTFSGSFDPDDAPPSGDPPRVLINGDAEFTNDPRVTLTVENLPRGTGSLEAANDGGFKPSQTFGASEGGDYPWTLSSTGPERLPKTVYVRLVTGAPVDPPPITDSIILDERPPVVVSARRMRKRLLLKTRDSVSGVAQVQATRNPRKPGKWARYAKRVAVPGGRGQISVRVRDRAGNRSKWKVVKP